MKCVKQLYCKGKDLPKVRRVSNRDAENMVKSMLWAYCPKSEWKALGRLK